MSNGTSTPITIKGEAGKAGSVVTIAENGAITIDGKETGFFATKGENGKVQVPYINEEGELITFDKEGNEVKTGIKKNTVVAVKNVDGSYTLTVPDADGKLLEIKLPSAASAIKNISVIADTEIAGNSKIELVKNTFNYSSSAAIAKKDWKGTKAVPADKTTLISSTDKVVIEVLPAGIVSAEDLNVKLIDAEGNVAENVEFTVKAVDLADGGSRATKDNSKFEITVNPVQLADGKLDAFDAQFGKTSSATLFALDINEGTFRTSYGIKVATINPLTVVEPDEVKLNGTVTSATNVINLNEDNALSLSKSGGTVTGIYDWYYTVEEPDNSLFGIQNGAKAHTFKATKENAGTFKMTINYLTNDGEVHQLTNNLTFKLSSKIDVPATYETVKHAIVANGETFDAAKDKNFFNVDLSTMHTSLGDKLAQWKKDVKGCDFEVFTKATCKSDEKVKVAAGSTNGKIDDVFGAAAQLVSKYENGSAVIVSGVADANFVKFAVNNTTANGDTDAATDGVQPVLTAGTTYYIKASFYNNASTKDATTLLNSFVVPVEFNIPAASEQVAVNADHVKNGVIQGIFYGTGVVYAPKAPWLKLDDFFTFKQNTVTLAVKEEAFPGTDYKTTDLFEYRVVDMKAPYQFGGETIKGIRFALNGTAPKYVDEKTGMPIGYGATITLTATVPSYEGWAYAKDNKFDFQIALMSSIYDGELIVKDNKAVVAKVSDLQGEGVKIGKDILWATTKSGVRYELFKLGASGKLAHDVAVDVANVAKLQYIKSATFVAGEDEANVGKPNYKPATYGNLVVKMDPNALAPSKAVDEVLVITLTDKWGFVKTQNLTVTVTPDDAI